jgi:hypothetical protein
LPTDAQLSKELGQSAIRLNISDTSNWISYSIFERGELIEYFQGEHGDEPESGNPYGIKTQRYVFHPYMDEEFYPDVRAAKQTVYFWSRRRQITARQIGTIWDFVRQTLVEYDAFDPAISSEDLLGASSPKRGNRYRIQNPGFVLFLPSGRAVTSIPDLVGVDYFRFGD